MGGERERVNPHQTWKISPLKNAPPKSPRDDLREKEYSPYSHHEQMSACTVRRSANRFLMHSDMEGLRAGRCVTREIFTGEV